MTLVRADGAVRPGVRSLSTLMPALLGGDRVDWLPEPVRDSRATAVLLLDGFGWQLLEAWRSHLPNIGAMTGKTMTSVVPSTTATALTSLTTGLAPSVHGVLGYRFREGGSVLNALRWVRDDGHKPPDPFTVQRHAPFRGRPVPVVTKSEFVKTGFTDAHLRGTRFFGWSTPAMLVTHMQALVHSGERFVYGYYPGIDSVCHEFGLTGPWLEAELAAVDRMVGDLLDHLPEWCALVITADHGVIEIPPDNWLNLNEVAPLVETYAGEGRFRTLFAKRGGARELEAEARARYSDIAWVFTRDELFDEGWMGEAAPTPSIRRRLGDVVLAPFAPVAFADPNLPRETNLKAVHGSMTTAEMTVPLIAARGRGK
jgi:predicted AlkP superfamily pyrophosphatase or phosphodiesterase